MKMRKLLAVVLAVTLAISAMALSAFATDYECYSIDMYNYDDLVTTTYTTSYTIEVPVYALYGYLVAGDTITLNLPKTISDYNVSYTLTVNGVTVELEGTDTNYDDGKRSGTITDAADNSDLFTQTVEVGYASRDYLYVSWASFEQNAMVPQSTSVSATTTMTITATIDYTDFYNTYYYDPTTDSWNVLGWWTDNGMSVIAEITSETNGTTSIYGYQATVAKATGSSDSTSNIIIIEDAADGQETVGDYLYWDHTLANRAIILNAVSTEGAYAELVVDLASSIKGLAIYTLKTYSNTESTTDWSSDAYWYSSATELNASASTYTLNGTTSTLIFDVPLSVLYDSDYGLYNAYMAIKQTISATSSSYNYYTNSSTGDLEATAVTLNIYMPVSDDTVVENDDPVENTNSETEDEELTVDDNEPAEEPETNPTTGIVLALVPMAVAAAAAVASKRR